jgi:hypothetical protein
MAKARAKGRPIAPLELSAEERTYLERQVRRHRVARSLSERCRNIVRTDCPLHADFVVLDQSDRALVCRTPQKATRRGVHTWSALQADIRAFNRYNQKPQALQMDQDRRSNIGFGEALLPEDTEDSMQRTLDSRD